MTKPPAHHQAIAAHLKNVITGVWHVSRVVNENCVGHIDVLRFHDRPAMGQITHATIGLSDTALQNGDRPFAARVELLMIGVDSEPEIGTAIGSAALMIAHQRRMVYPGAIIVDALLPYIENTTTPHIYLTAPFPWERADKSIDKLRVRDYDVYWLLGIPATDKEYELLMAEGDDVLEDMYASASIDISDVRRRSL